MNHRSKYGIGIASLMMAILLVNCGGGGSSPDSASAKGALSEQSVDNFAASISEELGCSYSDTGSAQGAVEKMGLLAAQRTVLSAFSSTKTATIPTRQKASARECSSPMAGDCGGTATICSSGESIIADFSKYCTQDYGGVTATLNGKVTIGISQSQDGSATYSASTQSPLNLKSVNPNTDENVDVTISVSNGVATKAASECGMHIKADSVSISDNIAKKQYSAKNVDVVVNDQCVATIEADYTDPQIGSVHVSGTSDNSGNSTVTLTDAKGSTATFSSGSGNNVFTITTNDNESGTMDCSAVDTSILNGLVPQS